MGTVVTLFWIGFGIAVLFMLVMAFRRSAPDKYTVEQRFRGSVESHWQPRIKKAEKRAARAAKRVENGSGRSAARASRRYIRAQQRAKNLTRDMGRDVEYHIKGAKGTRIGPDGQPRGGIGRYGTAHKGLMPLPQTAKERKKAARANKSIRITGRTERKRNRKNGK